MEKNLTNPSKLESSPEALFRQARNDADCRMTNPLTLAFIGDAVYSYYVRRYLIAKTNMNVDHLTKASVNYVKAEAQAYAIHHMDNLLTETEKAYALLSRLANKGFGKSVVCITKLKLSEIKAVKSCTDKLIAIKNAINFISGFKYDAILQCAEYQLLWNEKTNATLELCKEKDNLQAVDVLEQFVKEVKAEGFEVSVNKQLTKSIIAETIQRKYLIARDLELSKQFDEASAVYKNINSLEAKRTPTLSALRFILCKLKLQNYQDIIEHKDRIYTLLRNSADAFKSEKEDIAYRFALVLLKSGEDKGRGQGSFGGA